MPATGFQLASTSRIGHTAAFRNDATSTVMVLLFGLFTVLLIAALWLGTFSKQETMRGYVTASTGAVEMTSTVAGAVSNVWVAQGEKVRAGQKLVTVKPQQSSGGGESLSLAGIAALEAERANLLAESQRNSELLERDGTDRQRFDEDSRNLRDTLTRQVGELEAAVKNQTGVVEKFQRFLNVGYATREALSSQERIKIEYIRQLGDTRVQLAQLRTTETERLRGLDQARTQNANALSTIQSRIHDIDARIQRMKAEIATDILAVEDGQVAAINVREGSVVEPGQTLVALADPAAPVRIALEVPSRAIGLMEVGQRVVLKYDAFPYKTFGVKYGTVASVGSAPLALPRVLDNSSAADPRRAPPQSTYLVEVSPQDLTIDAYGVKRPILIGSTLSADVVVERRRLIDWVLDPILAVRGRT